MTAERSPKLSVPATSGFFEGAGLATLYVLPFAAGFLSASRGAAYHSLHPLTTVYRAVLIVIAGAWLLGWFGFATMSRFAGRGRRIAELLPLSLLPWLISRAAAGFSASLTESRLAFRIAPAVCIAALLLGIASLLLRPAIFDRSIVIARRVYQIAAFGMLILLPRVAWHAWPSAPPEHSGFARAGLPPPSPGEPRVVWLLLDELSYDQTFEHRQPDVSMPHFDALANSSIVFSDVRPAGDYTEKVIPGLLLGKALADMRMQKDGLLSYRAASGSPWQPFDQNGTIFADARSLGWTTGVAGWFNPYCRLMPDVLDRCFWQFSEPVSDDLARFLSSTQSVARNVLAMMPLRHSLSTLLHRPFPSGNQTHRDDYQAIMRQGEALVRDTRIRFVFIHLNVPHPAGIYSRARGQISARGTYLDNLVLADKSLGVLRGAIESTPAAANTTLIVSSDHSWRTYLWRGGAAWSPEDERATHGGRFDPRPVLVVHLPDSTHETVIPAPTSLLFVHTVLEGLLRGSIHSDSDITALQRTQTVAGASR